MKGLAKEFVCIALRHRMARGKGEAGWRGLKREEIGAFLIVSKIKIKLKSASLEKCID